MKVSYPTYGPGTHWFVVLGVDKSAMRVRWDDGIEDIVSSDLEVDIRTGAIITYPKQETLAFIKKHLHGN